MAQKPTALVDALYRLGLALERGDKKAAEMWRVRVDALWRDTPTEKDIIKKKDGL